MSRPAKSKKKRSNKKRRYPLPSSTKKRIGKRVDDKDVILKKGKGSSLSGGMNGGFFWHIFYKEERAGKVYINYDGDKKRADIQIFINQKSQGKGIGRVAYNKACKLSGYDMIYATMKKSNIASLKAAYAAGFRQIPSESNQVQMLWCKIDFPIEHFESLPSTLPKSSYIDFLLFLANVKQSLRIKVSQNETIKNLKRWCDINGFSFLHDEDHFVFIANDEETNRRLKQLDTSSLSHEYELGCSLGYPHCCCKKIESIGEENIDEYEKRLIDNSNFEGAFNLINPEGYKKGYALISHIPCAPTCENSLHIAQKSLYVISRYNERKCFEPWGEHWKQYVFRKY